MADTDNVASETVASETLKNDAPTSVETTQAPAAPSKEENQAYMRLAQEKKELEEKLAARERADAEARRKQLEEKEEFKALYEQTNARLQEIESAQEANARQAELAKATDDVLKDYPANVQTIAKTAGLNLTDDSEAGVAALKEKLDAIKATVPATTASPSNPRQTVPAEATREELTKRIRGGDKEALKTYINQIPGIQRMREIAEKGA